MSQQTTVPLPLPEKFLARMRELLGEDYPAFLAAEAQTPVRGVRVNPIKAAPDTYPQEHTLPLERLSYGAGTYLLHEEGGAIPLGATASHHAGEIYVQDPGAMSAVAAVTVARGARVIDLCAAPGGKAGQVAAAIGEEGLLVANEYVMKRARTAVENLERLGLTRALVTSQDTARLAELWQGVFDLVLCDAPCSGEGMFRKDEGAVREWSPENVQQCARRQQQILENAAALVAPGGQLLYSTCTYAPEENEETVLAFLDRHPDFTLIPVREEVAAVTRPGLPLRSAGGQSLTLTRRFYPHVAPGEGQFLALMQRSTQASVSGFLYKDAAKGLTREEEKLVDAFLADNLLVRPRGRLIRQGDQIWLAPEDIPLPPCPLLIAGVLLGELRGRLLVPSHHCFSALGHLFRRQEALTEADDRLSRYLCGEEIEARDTQQSGYVAILYRSAPLGGGKCSGGRIKNHYPKGLRMRSPLYRTETDV